MKVEIIVDGLSRYYDEDYEVLHCQDWNEKIRDLLDISNEVNEVFHDN